jgi:hypothetical protein
MKDTSEDLKKSSNIKPRACRTEKCVGTVLLCGYADYEAKVMKINSGKRRYDFSQYNNIFVRCSKD